MNHEYIDGHDVSSRYVAGRLAGAEELEFEAHLVDCPQCLDAVEAEMSLRDGLRTVGSASASQAAAPRSSGATRAHLLLRAAAAVLLAVSIGLAMWLVRTRRDLGAARTARADMERRTEQAERTARAAEQRPANGAAAANDARPATREAPLVPAAVFALTTVRSSSADGSPVNRIRIDPNAKLVVLSLEIPAATGSGDYEVSLKDRADRILWSGGPFPPSSSDSLDVAVDPAVLPAGDYVLELSRRQPSGGPMLIGRFPFRVTTG
jgi:hypothetical protein